MCRNFIMLEAFDEFLSKGVIMLRIFFLNTSTGETLFGIASNEHFIFQNKNNDVVAEHIYEWLKSKGL